MNVTSIGDVDWTEDDLRASLAEFSEIWAERPIKDNEFGIQSAHAYALHFLLKRLQPDQIIESGILFGQSTWLIEQALPEANVHCLDPIMEERLIYKSDRATYNIGTRFADFRKINWTDTPKDNTLVYFDDHIGVERIMQAYDFGFRKIVFEDNYASWGNGEMNCHRDYIRTGIDTKYSPKACFANGLPEEPLLRHIVKTYYEFPPIVPNKKNPRQRWHDIKDFTKPPLLSLKESFDPVFEADAHSYNWIAYIELE